jgi:uncharacterized protein involved in exopolysaccharide biosynthesis
MPGFIAVPRPHKLRDPAESQRPLLFYAGILRRHVFSILLLSIVLTALIVLGCFLLPPINAGSAIIAIDRQSSPETVGDNRLLSTGDDQFMATQQSLLQADTILRPVTARYELLLLVLLSEKAECHQKCTHRTKASQNRARSQYLLADHHLSR